MLWGLISALCFGTADFFAGKASRQMGAHAALFYMQLVGGIGLTIALLVTGQWQRLTPGTPMLAASGWMAVDLVGILLLYRALQVGLTSIVAPIASSFPVVTIVLSLISGERPAPVVLIAMAATIVGVTITAVAPGKGSPSMHPTRFTQGAFFAVLAALCLGTAFYGMRYPVLSLGGLATVWIGRLQATAGLFLLLRYGRHSLPRPTGPTMKWVVTVGILDALALLSYNLGLTTQSTSIVVTLTSLFALVAVAWGVFSSRERPAIHQWIGIATTLGAIAIVTLNGGQSS